MKFVITALLSLGLSTVVAAKSNQESIPQPINVRTFQVILSHDEPENDEVGKLQYRGGLDLRARPSLRRIVRSGYIAGRLTADFRDGPRKLVHRTAEL